MIYLGGLAAIHFAASTALGAMAVLSAKALYDIRRTAKRDAGVEMV